MSKARWTSDDFKKAGLIETPAGFVKSDRLVDNGKVDKIEPGANLKIRNAIKTEVNGIKFDSKLEAYMYGLLQGAGLTFEFQKEYLLQEKFRYNGEAIRAITLTVDFWLPTKNMIVDTKGYANDIAPMKYKMLKYLLFVQWETNHIKTLPKIELPSTKKECDMLLNKILFEL